MVGSSFGSLCNATPWRNTLSGRFGVAVGISTLRKGACVSVVACLGLVTLALIDFDRF